MKLKGFLFLCTLCISVQTGSASAAEVSPVNQSFVKIIALLAKRSDISRSQFREHYENNHVPLARGVFEGWPGYVRNHIDKVCPQQALNFDVLTMFWYRDLLHLQSTVELLNGETGQVIRADEHKFMSKATNRYYQVVESSSASLMDGARPWKAGFQKTTKGAAKFVALVPSVAVEAWLAVLENLASTDEPEALLAWVNNHIVDKPEGEFEQISELWFSNPATAEAAIAKWHRQLPEMIFLSVSPFESSIL